MSTRRTVHIDRRHRPEVNAGLWLEKYIESSARKQRGGEDQGGTSQARLVDETARGPAPQLYGAFFRRWEQALKGRGTRTARAEVLGRMVVGLGAESVLETAVTLQRTYGVPVIPGSALKGLAAACARQAFGAEWAAGGPAYSTMFGTTKAAGYLTFFDALYIPGSAQGDRPLAPDVLTVHHGEYYGGANVPPADWDSPTPVPFISAHGGYLLAIDGPDEWVARGLAILAWGLAERGIGAKTSSGYGRMRVAGVALPGAPPETTGRGGPQDGPGHARPPTGGGGQPMRRRPEVGDIFAGTVEERDERRLALNVPGFPPEAAVAVLEITADTPQAWVKGAKARVEVTAVEERDGRVMLTVRRAPKERKG